MHQIKKIIVSLLLLLSLANSGDFLELSLSDFIRFVSSETNENYIVDESVNKKISVFLPADYQSIDTKKVLNDFLINNTLILKRTGTINYITVESKDSLFFYDSKFLQPLEIIATLNKNFPNIRFINVNKKIIYETTKKESEKINYFINMIDVPIPQKTLKINLIYFNNDDLKEFGVNLDVRSGTEDNNLQFKSFLSNLVLNQSISKISNSSLINFYFSDLHKNGLVDFKFSPVVTLTDGKDTIFDIVKNIPYLNQTRESSSTIDSVNNSYAYKDVGTQINITKVSIVDDDIYFQLDLIYETITESSPTPSTSKRKVSNYIKLSKNESMLLSGLTSSEITQNNIQVPILAKIPYLGEIFKYNYNSNKNETFAIYIENVDGGSKEATDSKKGSPLAGK
jgi:type II secretory pathway component GspD/PulD (secretin)